MSNPIGSRDAIAEEAIPQLTPATAASGRASRLGGVPLVMALTGIGVGLCSATDAFSRATLAPSLWFLWAGLAVIVAPIVYRLCSADASTAERVALVCLLGLELYVVKLMRDPFGYTMPDEFFHAYNAQQIASHHALFNANSLLPVTSRYPGLEGATSALMKMTGMSSFGAGLLVVGAARLSLMLGLFALFLTISDSPRIAGLGAAAYAANSNFLLWGAQYSYESLALPLLVVVLASVAARGSAGSPGRRYWSIPIVLLIGAIVVTHHLTSYLLDAALAAIAALVLFKRWRGTTGTVWPFALTALVLTVAWLVVVASETVGYISPVVSQAFTDTFKTILGEAAPRAPFQATLGISGAPLAERIVAFATPVILLVALPFGLIPAWRRNKRNPIALLLCVAAVGFFAVLALRLAPSAWEIGNRADEFLFIGLAFVLAYTVVDRLLLGASGRRVPLIVGAVAAFVAVGGAITGWPLNAVLAAPVRVAADGRRIESETFAIGRWVRAQLPTGSFAAPEADARTILLYGNGRVQTGTTIQSILSSPTLRKSQLAVLHRRGVRLVVVDRRQRGNDNTLGYRFSLRNPPGPADTLRPPGVDARFDALPAPRVFDSGDIAVYDLKGIQ